MRRGPSGSKECGRRDGIRMVACQCGGIYRRLLFLFFDILRRWGLSMPPFCPSFSQKIKIKNKKISRRRRRLLKFLFLLILFSVEKKEYRINVVV